MISARLSTRASSNSFASGCCRRMTRTILDTLTVVDQQLGYSTPNGPFWHRASFDGYGEKADGSEWEPTPTGSRSDSRTWLAAAHRRARRVPAGRRVRGTERSRHHGPVRAMTRAGCFPSRCGTTGRRQAAGRPSSRVSRPSPPPRWPGRTPSSSGWLGPSMRARRSRPRNRSPAVTPARSAVTDPAAAAATLVFGIPHSTSRGAGRPRSRGAPRAGRVRRWRRRPGSGGCRCSCWTS